MAITIEQLTTSTLDGTGIFDVLMRTIRTHVNDAVQSNEITQNKAGDIYTGVIPSTLNASIDFLLQKELTELKIDDSIETTLGKKTDRINQTAKLRAEIDKQLGYTTTLDGEGIITLGADDLGGLVDEQINDLKEKLKLAKVATGRS